MAAVRILIADDNDLAAQTLAEQLSSLGYEVAGVARTATEVPRLSEQLRPDLVIMDMHLPELAGETAPRQLGARIHVPVVMVTGFSDADSRRIADEAGAMAYLVKPINPEELPPAIDVALARHTEFRQLRRQVDDLHDTLESHKLVERAIGILMKRLNISKSEAEERLRQRAKEKQVRLQDIAQTIVDSDSLLS